MIIYDKINYKFKHTYFSKAKTGCVYQKPGPPTPGNTRRNSKGSRSPGNRRNSKTAKSPRTPMSLRSRRSPKRTPKNSTPHRNSNIENGSSGKKVLQHIATTFGKSVFSFLFGSWN